MIDKEIAKKFYYEGIYDGGNRESSNPLLYDEDEDFEKFYNKIVKENFHEDHAIIRKCKDITDDYFMYHMQYKDDGDIYCYYKKKEVDEK